MSHAKSQGKQSTGDQKKNNDRSKQCIIDHILEPVMPLIVYYMCHAANVYWWDAVFVPILLL
jgi:hypothetical protein